MPFMKVAMAQEVPPGSAKQVNVNGRLIGVFNRGGKFYALEDVCPHRGAPLTEGVCDGTEVICSWHGASFDLATGAHLAPPAVRGVATFRVQVLGDEIQVEV